MDFQLIADLFMNLADAELDLSIAKGILNQKIQYSADPLYYCIANGQSAITPKNIYNLMKALDITISESNSLKLVQSIGLMSGSSISRKEFKHYLDQSEFEEVTLNQQNEEFIEVTDSTLYVLGNLLKKEL